jgi:hypothetical protein
MYGNYTLTLLVKDDNRHTPSEVFEILAHPKEVHRHIITKKEILHLRTNRSGTSISVIVKTIAIAHLSIENLASGESFIPLYKVKDIVRQPIVRTPRNILYSGGQSNWHNIHILLEHLRRIHGEGDRRRATKLFNAV